MKRVLSFTLYGTNPRYTVGAVKNAILAARIYPDFLVRFYFGSDVPRQTLTTLGIMPNVEIFRVDGYHGAFSNAWRFLAFSDPDVEIAMMRDADARITVREKIAVDEWLASGIEYHSMKDHPTGHKSFPINAGMWGGRTEGLRHMKEIMQDFRARKIENGFAADQAFLAFRVAPLVYKNMIIHDSFNKTEVTAPSERKSFPVPLANFANHVGAAMDENDLLVYPIDRRISETMGGNGYFQYDIPVPEMPYPTSIPAEQSAKFPDAAFHDYQPWQGQRAANRPPRGAFSKVSRKDGGLEGVKIPGAFDRKVVRPDGTIETVGNQFDRKPLRIDKQAIVDVSSGQWARKPVRLDGEEDVPKEVAKMQWDKKNRPLR